LTSGNHPGYVLGCWLRDYARQVRLLTSGPAVERANNASEQGAMAAAPRRRDRNRKPQLAHAPKRTPRSGIDVMHDDRRGDGAVRWP